jgi:hypothetical protein
MEPGLTSVRMSDFLNPNANAVPIRREITYDPRNAKQTHKARVFRGRAQHLGLQHDTVVVPGGKKLIISGPRGLVLKTLNYKYAGTMRRVYNFSGHRSATRRRNRA